MQRAIDAYQRGDLTEAERLCRVILNAKPDYFDALNLLGIVAAQTRRTREAVELLSRAISVGPNSADAHSNLGGALRDLNRPEEALRSCDQALTIKSDHAEALFNRGNALADLRRYEEALESYGRGLTLKPANAGILNNLGVALAALKRYEEALESCDRALKINPHYAEALYNRGNALANLRRTNDALESYDRALAIKPDYAEALNNRGNALSDLKRPEEALESYDRALTIKPDYADALNNRGHVLGPTRAAEALQSYDHALKIKADYPDALNNRGNALRALKRPKEALASYDRALKIKSDYAEALSNRGIAFSDLKRHEEALESYDRALKINPNYEFLYGAWLDTKMRICDWRNLQNDISTLIKKVSCGEKVSPPFTILVVSNSPALQQKVAEIWVKDNYPLRPALPKFAARSKRGKIRVGYFSADYYDHATAHLVAGLFEWHDKSKFELIAFSFGPDTNDEMSKRVAAAFDKVIDVRARSDRDVALLSRQLEVDIAVDLKGFTQDSRPGIFASRAAPLQVNYLGYPGTMGAEYIDYLIADPTLIPKMDQQHYSEKIAYLPDSYQVNDTRRRISDKVFTREEAGLPQTAFVFCCFNNNFKFTPCIFDSWMRLLIRVEGSVFWLFEDNLKAADNLREEAVQRGVSADRLIFAKRIPLSEHLARHRLADLFIDTFPCNAHTTASDALWAGLPVLTYIGETFASRVAASLLNAIHLPELITSTQKEYEALAIELATNPDRLRKIRHKLANNRLTAPLFNIQLSAKHIEAAYTEMYERHQAGLPPDHIHVQPQ